MGCGGSKNASHVEPKPEEAVPEDAESTEEQRQQEAQEQQAREQEEEQRLRLEEEKEQRRKEEEEEQQRRRRQEEEQRQAEEALKQQQAQEALVAREMQEAEERQRMAEVERRRVEEENEQRRLQEEADRVEEEKRKLANARDVLYQGVKLNGLLNYIARLPELSRIPPQDWMDSTMAAATASKKCRFTSTLEQDQVLPPTYYCVLSPQWSRPVKEVLDIIMDHIQEMEPGCNVGDMGVWLSCLADNPYNSQEVQAAERKEVELALQDALPTLVCLERPKARGDAASGQNASMGATNALGSVTALRASISTQAQGTRATANEEPSTASQAPTTAGQAHAQPAAASLSLLGVHSPGRSLGDIPPAEASHEPTLKLYRIRAGLRGFQGAMFRSVRLVYLD